jgi:tight adherence protein C
MIYGIFLFIILGVCFITIGVTTPSTYVSIAQRLPSTEKKANINILYKLLAPFRLLSRIFLKFSHLEQTLSKKLALAHSSLSPVDYVALKILLLVVLLIITAFFKISQTTMILVVIGSGYLLPDFILNKKISKRKYAISRSLPETVDLLGLCIEAGLDFTTGVKWIIEKTKSSPMIEELSVVLKEIQWGKPRNEALKDMSKRLNIPEVTSFVQTLVQADRMGTPVAEAFSILSEDTRQRRFNRGERQALKAPIKILIPLIFCIFPVIGIIIAGPIILQFMQQGFLRGIGGG